MFLEAATERDKQISQRGRTCKANLLVEFKKVENFHIKR